MSATAACLNCNHQLPSGAFCPNCGQKHPHRLTVGHVAHEIFHVFTHADNTIIGYIPRLLLQPGRVVADYLAGRRKRYFNPFQFLLIIIGLATAATAILHYYEATGLEMQARYANRMPAENMARMVRYFKYVGKYYNLWWLLLALPLYAFFTWLIYRKRGLNYAESFFVNVIIGSAFNVYLTLFMLSMWALSFKASASNNLASGLQVVVILLYLILIGRQGLGLTWTGAGWRALVTVLLNVAGSLALNALAFRWYVFR